MKIPRRPFLPVKQSAESKKINQLLEPVIWQKIRKIFNLEKPDLKTHERGINEN